MISFEEVQQAAYNRLVGDVTLTSKLAQGASSVMDQMEQEPPYPLVHLDYITATPYWVHGETPTADTAYLHMAVWSKKNSWAEADAIARDVVRLLGRYQVVQGDYNLQFMYGWAHQIRSPDGKLRQIAFRFKVLALDP